MKSQNNFFFRFAIKLHKTHIPCKYIFVLSIIHCLIFCIAVCQTALPSIELKEGDKEILPIANAWSTHVHFLGVNTKSAKRVLVFLLYTFGIVCPFNRLLVCCEFEIEIEQGSWII